MPKKQTREPMSRKSNTCYGKISQKPLTEYDSESEAMQATDYAKHAYQSYLVPYKCGRCGYWHLAPKNRQTPSEKCYHCTGQNGRAKETYESREDAERRAEIIYQERGYRLYVYPCSHRSGYHLTKNPI